MKPSLRALLVVMLAFSATLFVVNRLYDIKHGAEVWRSAPEGGEQKVLLTIQKLPLNQSFFSSFVDEFDPYDASYTCAVYIDGRHLTSCTFQSESFSPKGYDGKLQSVPASADEATPFRDEVFKLDEMTVTCRFDAYYRRAQWWYEME
jgi:hypothetical protein